MNQATMSQVPSTPLKPVFYPQAYHDFYVIFQPYNVQLVRVLRSLLDAEPLQIVDLACGTGLSTLALRKNFGTAHIHGMDVAADMIDYAQSTIDDDRISFRCTERGKMLDAVPHHSVDLIFVKSAYHHFEHQVALADMAQLLRAGGAIVIAERTERSARSFPLPDIAQRFWADFFAQPLVDRRLAAGRSLDLQLTVSCYGRTVDVPAPTYFDAIRNEQLFGLWAVKPTVCADWIAEQSTRLDRPFTVFEEFWLYVYHA